VLMMYCKTLLQLLMCHLGKVRDCCGGMGRFKGRLKCKGWVSCVITDVITLVTAVHAGILKNKYNVKTCMYTISPLYQIIHFNEST